LQQFNKQFTNLMYSVSTHTEILKNLVQRCTHGTETCKVNTDTSMPEILKQYLKDIKSCCLLASGYKNLYTVDKD
jgi:hypothetical protein